MLLIFVKQIEILNDLCVALSQVVICHSESCGEKGFLALIHFLKTNFVVGEFGFLIFLCSRGSGTIRNCQKQIPELEK